MTSLSVYHDHSLTIPFVPFQYSLATWLNSPSISRVPMTFEARAPEVQRTYHTQLRDKVTHLMVGNSVP